jgi:hypothetical protein
MVTWGGKILRDDVIIQPDTGLKKRAMTTGNSDVIGAIRKDQGANYGERATIVTTNVQFLICFN